MAHTLSWVNVGDDWAFYVNDKQQTVSPVEIKNGDVIRIEPSTSVSVNGTTYSQATTLALSDTDIAVTVGSTPSIGGDVDITINYTETAIVATKTLDLTTLSNWANLAYGDHTVKIVAKADGYRDSDASASVTVNKIKPNYLTFTGETGDFNLTLGSSGAKEWDGTVEYSTDASNWTVWDGTSINSANSKLYLRGKNNTKFFTAAGACLKLSEKASCSGNINFLLDYENPPTTIGDSSFSCLFYGCTNLTAAPELPATTLGKQSYSAMFHGCTSLATAPALPATTLGAGCYYMMFKNCSALTTPPELLITTLEKSCYQEMFSGCTGLTAAPTLPATIMTEMCYYNMFKNCSSLTVAPDLPATTLATECYYSMFEGCAALVTPPSLPATTMATRCYSMMFIGCKTLVTPPELPATSLASSCYENMFFGCSALAIAPALPATTLSDSCYDSMFAGCSSLIAAPELPATTLSDFCYNGMFSRCTSLTTLPVLPATTLANYCYDNMFTNCTSLTYLPDLPATTLADGCYYSMFYGCSGIKISASQTDEYKTAWIIPSSGTISSAATDWNMDMFRKTGGTQTGNPAFNTTYYGAWEETIVVGPKTLTVTDATVQVNGADVTSSYTLKNGDVITATGDNGVTINDVYYYSDQEIAVYAQDISIVGGDL